MTFDEWCAHFPPGEDPVRLLTRQAWSHGKQQGIAQERASQPDQGGKTGWPAGMLQDDSRELSKALAGRPNARQEMREVCASIQASQEDEKVASAQPLLEGDPPLSADEGPCDESYWLALKAGQDVLFETLPDWTIEEREELAAEVYHTVRLALPFNAAAANDKNVIRMAIYHIEQGKPSQALILLRDLTRMADGDKS